MMMTHLLSARELGSLISQSGQSAPVVRILDCRFDLANPAYGEEVYRTGHIPGAVHASLEIHGSLASVKREPLADAQQPAGHVRPGTRHGGRHPLPDPADFAAFLSNIGIERDRTRIVTYDDAGGCYAARFWWLLRWCGHTSARVLDGGWQAWLDAGGESTVDVPAFDPCEFTPELHPELLCTMEEVRQLRESGRLFDARARDRFRGENEAIDPIAGHIPGAINLPWADTLGADGRFLPIDMLSSRFAQLPDDAVMQCGSGVTACVNVLLASECGRPVPRLYAGSWSDWISHPENPVSTGAE